MLNDSGNEPMLYLVNTKGKIKKTYKIGAKNNDWEDLTTDDKGNIYIGDFGNNGNHRKNLTILKFNISETNTSDTVNVERISFKDPGQTAITPARDKRHFDCESFFFYNDSLYLCTKSRSRDDFGRTDLYKLPSKPGEYQATYISSFNTCEDISCWVTSADISPDKTKVVLLNYDTVWLFTGFKGDNFFNGKVTKLYLDDLSQKEGICFKDNKRPLKKSFSTYT